MEGDTVVCFLVFTIAPLGRIRVGSTSVTAVASQGLFQDEAELPELGDSHACPGLLLSANHLNTGRYKRSPPSLQIEMNADSKKVCLGVPMSVSSTSSQCQRSRNPSAVGLAVPGTSTSETPKVAVVPPRGEPPMSSVSWSLLKLGEGRGQVRLTDKTGTCKDISQLKLLPLFSCTLEA